MFTTIQPHEISDNTGLLTKAARLRKRVFADQLGWSVPVIGDEERDCYDTMGATFLVWCSDDRQTLYGVLRLLPTTGPTLLHDVFHATHGRNPELKDPQIWEGTRMCVDVEMIARDFPHLDPADGFNMMFLALCEAAMAHGIKRLVSNFEACMSRVYRRAGLRYDLHGRADGYGAKPVHCASFAVGAEALSGLRQRLKIDIPVFTRSPRFARLVAPAVVELEPMLEAA